ncbi:hypothetical protein Dimus_037087 [Dionaea muscipula]
MVKLETSKTFTPGEVPKVQDMPKEEHTSRMVTPTPEQIIAIKAAIVNSQTLEEVARLEKALKSGLLPENLKITDAEPIPVDGNCEDNKMDTDHPPESELMVEDAKSEENTQPEVMEQVKHGLLVPSVSCPLGHFFSVCAVCILFKWIKLNILE